MLLDRSQKQAGVVYLAAYVILLYSIFQAVVNVLEELLRGLLIGGLIYGEGKLLIIIIPVIFFWVVHYFGGVKLRQLLTQEHYDYRGRIGNLLLVFIAAAILRIFTYDIQALVTDGQAMSDYAEFSGSYIYVVWYWPLRFIVAILLGYFGLTRGQQQATGLSRRQ